MCAKLMQEAGILHMKSENVGFVGRRADLQMIGLKLSGEVKNSKCRGRR
jgi:hypothetical protein